ncbi:unnamed protein product, partial [Vitis vinifera]
MDPHFHGIQCRVPKYFFFSRVAETFPNTFLATNFSSEEYLIFLKICCREFPLSIPCYLQEKKKIHGRFCWRSRFVWVHSEVGRHGRLAGAMTNPLVKMWLHDLRDLAYDVEDILDESVSQALRRNLIVAQPQPPTGTRLRRLPSTSLVIESCIYGRETEKAAILAMLLKDDPSDDEVCVIPIVGMGGIGKTVEKKLFASFCPSLLGTCCVQQVSFLFSYLKLNKDHGGKKVDSIIYKQIVGSLMYLTATRPDIMHSVSLISRYMENPTELHFLAAKKICRYLQGTKDFGLFYKKGKRSDLIGFTDSDYAGDQDNRRSTSGYVFMLGTGAVSWSSKKQPIVTLSTTEAEFVAATVCACQAIWLRKILEELHLKQVGATTIFCDNSSTIKLSKNPVLHGRSKHIDVKYYFLRDLSNDGVIDLVYCRSENQVADIFTKPLKLAVFLELRKVTKTILQSLSPHTRYANNLNLLQIELREKLYRKKFLLILDVNFDEWDILCMPMRAGASGSKLIVTTRYKGVVSVTGTCSAYPLQELSYDDCLSLFTRQALGARNLDAYPHLKEVGEEIVKRCKGPCYHHLPSHLKRCFAYCSIFPKDYEFDKDELILLWMAEGFLQQTKEENQPEKLGCEYFDDLFSRSFFQQSTQNSSQFLMHDLINDLAQSISGDICFNLNDELENNKQSMAVSEKARHLSFNRQRYEMMRKFEAFRKAKCLRTLAALPLTTFSTYFISSKVLDDLLKEMKYARSVNLQKNQNIKELTLKWSSDFGIVQPFPSLELLKFKNMPTWEDWFFPDADEEVEPFPFLRELTIRRCSKLGIQLPDCLPSLVKLDIFGLISLQELKLERCPKLVSFPEAALSPLLRSVEMMHHKSSSTVGKNTCCLEKLWIKNCSSLKFFPAGDVINLNFTHIQFHPQIHELSCRFICARLYYFCFEFNPVLRRLERALNKHSG